MIGPASRPLIAGIAPVLPYLFFTVAVILGLLFAASVEDLGVRNVGTAVALLLAMHTAESNLGDCNVGWLLFVLRAERRRQRLCVSGGSDTGEDFRRGVRERLADGRLFLASGVSTLRRGSGRPCNVCGKAITETQEHEVEGRGDTYALAHPDCYRVWREESRRMRPPER
jgi:hypothetical protein